MELHLSGDIQYAKYNKPPLINGNILSSHIYSVARLVEQLLLHIIATYSTCTQLCHN